MRIEKYDRALHVLHYSSIAKPEVFPCFLAIVRFIINLLSSDTEEQCQNPEKNQANLFSRDGIF